MLLAFILGVLGSSTAFLAMQWYFDRMRERSIDRMVEAYKNQINDLKDTITEYEQEGRDGQ